MPGPESSRPEIPDPTPSSGPKSHSIKPGANDSQSAPTTPPTNLTSETAAPQVPDHELIRKIGDGSYGEVWLARNAVGTLRAVKVVLHRTFEDTEHFEREFKGLKAFEPVSRAHDGLVDILHLGRNDASGYFYYVMELADPAASSEEQGGSEMEGGGGPEPETTHPCLRTLGTEPTEYSPRTLRAELDRYVRLPVLTCVQHGVRIAEALDHLHQNGLVHRDVKPSNIIVVNGRAKLADIGLVTEVSEARSFVGTMGFIPPEGPGTAQADLYGLGKVLCEASTGKDRRQFPQLSADVQEQAEHEQLLEFNEIILQACETDPKKRYSSATAMVDDLALLQAGHSVRRHRSRRDRLILTGKLLAAVVALCLLGLLSYAVIETFFTEQQSPNTLSEGQQPAATREYSIAVLPFRASGTNAQHNLLANRIVDGVIAALRALDELTVAPRKWVHTLTENQPNALSFRESLHSHSAGR